MKRLFFILVIAIVLICGCSGSMVPDVRNYSHNPSDNVTIYVLKYTGDNITVIRSDPGVIRVIEKAYVPVGGSSYLENYVRFAGDEENLSIYVRLIRPTDGWPGRNDAYADVEIDIPQNTSYNITYVGYNNFAWPE